MARKKRRGGRTGAKTGSVKGLAPNIVTDTLWELTLKLLSNPNGLATRARAAEILDNEGWEPTHRDALLATLIKLPGVKPGPEDGTFYLPDPAFVRLREWRMALGRVDIADAAALLRVLDSPLARPLLTPDLLRLRDRLKRAVAPLIDPFYDGEK